MRSTFMADQAARDDARVTLESTSADGEPQLIELRGHQVRSLERGLTDDQRRRRAWRANRSCCTCGDDVATFAEVGVLQVEGVDRVAHRKHCLAAAIVTHCVTVARVTAIGGLR